MAIVLDTVNDIETDFNDFIKSLDKNNGLRCCLDVDMFTLNEFNPTTIRNIRLIPLENFTCKRTIKGCNGTDIKLDARFGFVTNDFISFDFNTVDLIEDDGYRSKGLLISSDNIYYDIIEQLAVYFKFISIEDTGNSFILNADELSQLSIVPFHLEYENANFYVDNIECEMSTGEFDKIIDAFNSDNAI